ncbi:MAG: GNAT family N-acetyltransferase [Candidatus Acidiferrales bacterium]
MQRNFDFAIRAATSDDVPGILQCLRAAFAPFRARYTIGAFRDTVLSESKLPERMKRMKIFVAVDECKNVAGTIGCSISGSRIHLRGMAVRPALQGCGVAARLLAMAENEMRESKCSCITLDTTEPLARAIQFYRRHGYRASGRVRDFFGMRLYEYVKRAVANEK